MTLSQIAEHRRRKQTAPPAGGMFDSDSLETEQPPGTASLQKDDPHSGATGA